MSLPAVPFWFIRHGQTDYNLAGLAQGALDANLNETGRSQAQQAGPVLKNRGITSIVSSPLCRTRETTTILNEFLHLPISYEDELREVSFGDLEGKPAQPWFPEWVEGRYTPENGENFAALRTRVGTALCRILTPKTGMVLVVAHGGVLRAIRDLMSLPKEVATGNAIPLYCDPTPSGWQIINAADAPRANSVQIESRNLP